MQSQSSIPVVIIAGGQGSRIGGGKALRVLAGQSLFDRSLHQAQVYSSKIAVAVSVKNELPSNDGILFLLDETNEVGPISGLSSALRYAAVVGADHVLVMSCDTPFLPVNLMEKLRASIGEAYVAVAHCEGRMHPACGLWSANAINLLPAYLAQGRRSLIGFAEAVGYVAVEWSSAPVDPFFNINTAQDLSEAELILAKTTSLY